MSLLDIREDDDAPEVAAAPPSARWALGLSTAVCWFFVQGAGLLVAAVHRGIAELLDGSADLTTPFALAALLAFAAPMVKLAPRWGREGVATRAALLTFAAGIAGAAALVAVSAGAARGGAALMLVEVPALLAVAGGSTFLMAMIGLVNRRAAAGGLVGGLLVRQLHAAVGEVNGAWIALTAATLVLGLISLRMWRAAPAEERGETFERRAGGMRLRGALALGAILFLELGVGLVVRGHRLPLETTSLAIALAMVPPALAWLFVVRGIEAPRHRLLAVAGALAVGSGLLLAPLGHPAAGNVLAHTAALMLIGRALSPASGRRLGKHLTMGLLLFALLSTAYLHAFASARDMLAAAWVAAAVLVLVAMMYLTPRPARADAVLPDRVAFGIALALPLLAALAAALRAS